MTTETTALVRSFADQIAEMGDIPATGALEPGRIWWLHGVKQAKTPGVFYARATEFAAPPAAPWQPDNRFDDEQGYSAAALRLAVIGVRSQWFIPNEDRTKPPRWVMDYEREVRQAGESAKKQVEYLVLVEGTGDPMVLSVSGKNKAAPIAEALNSYRNGLLKQASRIVKRQLPLWAFWLPFSGATKDGKTLYLEAADANGKTYGSVVTPPALALPSDAMETLFVGPELLRWGAELAQQYTGWLRTLRGTNAPVEGEYEVVETRALPAPRNVPQPLPADDEDGVPF